MEILYRDNEIVVCVKPVGISSEDGADSLPALLRAELGGEIFPLHRLDLNVGGVMVYARTKTSAARLSKAIQDGVMVKEYRCLVHGAPPQSGDWQDLLWKDSSKNKVFVVKRMRKGVKNARLEFQRLTEGETSLVHVRLHTGRSHQIRVQFASRGFPLVGDHKYGSRDEATAPMLFSCRISFPHKGKLQTFEHYPEWGKTE
jgi:23S rRNA pseudouridine1911/1915/1917 synthase